MYTKRCLLKDIKPVKVEKYLRADHLKRDAYGQAEQSVHFAAKERQERPEDVKILLE
jgi:hypothetical protein